MLCKMDLTVRVTEFSGEREISRDEILPMQFHLHTDPNRGLWDAALSAGEKFLAKYVKKNLQRGEILEIGWSGTHHVKQNNIPRRDYQFYLPNVAIVETLRGPRMYDVF